MSSRKKLMKGGLQLVGGHGTIRALAIARNFCVARLISPEDFGIAATFALTLSMLEAISDLSFDKLLIQDRDGDDPAFQAVLQTLSIFRGFFVGAVIFAAAEPIARIFDVPEAATGYRCLALAPILTGFTHLDIFRMHRSLNFSPGLQLLLLAHTSGFVVASGSAWLLRDYTAVLWGLLAQAAVQGLGAHLFAERPYRLKFQGAMMVKALHFGWPLMLNGLLIMLATQGDRLLIGAQLTMTDLAVYTLAAMMANVLQSFILKVNGSLSLPWLAAAQGSELFVRRYNMISNALAVLVLAAFLPLTLFGSQLITFVFGADYRTPTALVGWLALAAALRVQRGGGPVLCSLAKGDTKNLMLSNLVRLVGILAAALVVFVEGGLAAVAAAMCLGEFAAYWFAVHRLGRVLESATAVTLRCLAVVVGAFLVALALDTALPQDALVHRAVLTLAIAVAAAVAITPRQRLWTILTWLRRYILAWIEQPFAAWKNR